MRVGRVIARPFVGTAGAFRRTANRHDYALTPPRDTLLDLLTRQGIPVVSIGKVRDLFAGRGIARAIPTKSDSEGVDRLIDVIRSDGSGLVFINLVDFDTLYGHRNDVEGYANNLERFDERLGQRAAGVAGIGSVDHHRRSRQRSDDAQHRSLARARPDSHRRLAGPRGRQSGDAAVRSPIWVRPWPPISASALWPTAPASWRRSLSSIREALEQRELETLAPQAAKSSQSRGRLTSEPEDDVRPAFQHDRDRIIHSQGVQAAEAQDAGLLRAGRRSLPHASHAHTRGLTDRANDREGASASRRADRVDCPRSRPRPHAVRSRRRARARLARARRVQALRAEPARSWTCSRTTGVDSTSRGRFATASDGTRRARTGRRSVWNRPSVPRRWKGRSCVSPTSLPTSITTSTMPCGRA